MPSRRTALQGAQEPRIKLAPSYVTTDGPDAAYLSSQYGLTPDPWQADVLDSWLGRDKHDIYTASRCGLMVPRQNGKNGVLEMRELYGAAVLGEKILHTAHEVKTARKAFIRLCEFFDNPRQYPELADMVADIRRTNGQEAIILKNGGSVEFIARSRGSGRGFTVDVVVCDEAQELTDEQLQALMFTMSSAPLHNHQLILTGTPPNHNAAGEVLGRVRAEGHEGKNNHLSWFEWGVDSIGDVTDRSRWEATNPALGYRLNVSAIEDELATMSADGFARERLGWWPSMAANAVIGKSEWAALATDNPPADGKIAYGIKFSPDGATVALAVAMKPAGENGYVELIEHRSTSGGITWLADWLTAPPRRRWRDTSCIVIDGMSGAENLIGMLAERGVPKKVIIPPRTRDVIAAASKMLNAVREGEITHYGQPALDESALHAQKRTIGNNGGWGFGAIGDSDASPLEASSLAYWGVMTSKRNPKRKQVLL